jgi:hypothetical protein
MFRVAKHLIPWFLLFRESVTEAGFKCISDKCHANLMIVFTTGKVSAPVYLNHEQ